MELEEVKQLIRSGESDCVEFKESFDNDTRETVGAFSNTKGGHIFIGVTDDGKIKGTQIGANSIVDMISDIANSTQPRVVTAIEHIRIDEKDIIAIRVIESGIKPIAVRGKCFKRVNKSNRLMSPQDISEMYTSCIGKSSDSTVPLNTSIDDIDFSKVKKYIDNAQSTGRLKLENTDPSYFLEKFCLTKAGNPTLTAILLFGKSPIDKIPYAKVHCGRVKGSEIIDDKYIEGTIIEQVDDVIGFILKNINVRYEITGTPERKEVWEYPRKALREAVINAICHRDYTCAFEIDVKIFDDNLVIWNPGGLMPGFTIKDLYDPYHISKPRNPLIAARFYDINLIEKHGSGTTRIIDDCKENNMPTPLFEEKYGGLYVTFQKDKFTEEQLKAAGFNEKQIKTILYIKQKGKITNSEYQAINSVGKRYATQELEELRAKGVIKRIGTTGKGTHYVLIH